MKKKFWISSLYATLSFSPLITIVSCSSPKESALSVFESDEKLYENIWDQSFINGINNFSETTLNDIENYINQQIKNNSNIKKTFQAYLAQYLFSSIFSPYDRSGNINTNKNEQLQEIEIYLKNKIITPDDLNADDKTFKKLNKFVESIFDIKVNILFFKNNDEHKIEVAKDIKVKNALNIQKDILNFQFEFKVKDENLNNLLINSNGLLKNSQTREEIKKVRQLKQDRNSQDIILLVDNQFTYQGTKLYYDKNNKSFKSIVLPSNVNATYNRNTSQSGFNKNSDKERKLFYFDWKNIKTNEYNSYLVMKLSNDNYFDTSVGTSWWRKYLESYKLLEKNTSHVPDIYFNLDRSVYFKKQNEN